MLQCHNLLQHLTDMHAIGMFGLTKVPKIDSHSTEMGNDVMVAVLQCEPGCSCGFRPRQGHGLEGPRHAEMNVHNF